MSKYELGNKSVKQNFFRDIAASARRGSGFSFSVIKEEREKDSLEGSLDKRKKYKQNSNNDFDDENEDLTRETMLGEVMHHLKKDKKAMTGGIIVILFVLTAIFAPLIAPHDPYLVDMDKMFIKPSSEYLMGTDFIGRDILSRMIYGARISLIIGLVPTIISLTIGTTLGMIAGYLGGKVDYLIMCLADICMFFPSILLAMVVMYTLGSSLFNIFIALSIVGWGGTARIIRSQTLTIKEKEFVEVAIAMGVGKHTLMWRHIFPNTIPSLAVLFTLNVPAAIMSEAGLSFLGVGAQPPTPSWGLMISRGKEFLFSAPWVTIMPGIAIFIVVIAFNFIGDGLRDALDPYTRN